jgi:hypothetical protein
MRQLYLAVAVPKITYGLDVWYTPPHKNCSAQQFYSLFLCRLLTKIVISDPIPKVPGGLL